MSLCKDILELQKAKSTALKRSRLDIDNASAGIVNSAFRSAGIPLPSSSGFPSSISQATVPLPSPTVSLLASPVLEPAATNPKKLNKYGLPKKFLTKEFDE